MPLSIVTNTSAMTVRFNLNSATDSMTQAIERMTTGFKVNSAKDDAAGYNIIDTMTAKIGSFDVAGDNSQIGLDMLMTTEENYALITTHLQRIRDLTEQASNGTYSEDSLLAINREITQRLEEINRISATAEYNGMFLMDGTLEADKPDGIRIQAGINGDDASGITLDISLFASAMVEDIMESEAGTSGGADIEEMAKNFTGVDDTGAIQAGVNPWEFLSVIDGAITNIATRITNLGAAQNRLESAMSAVDTNITQLTNSRSTMRDADVAEESTNYISAQILQTAAATLLATANQMPAIATQLI